MSTSNENKKIRKTVKDIIAGELFWERFKDGKCWSKNPGKEQGKNFEDAAITAI